MLFGDFCINLRCFSVFDISISPYFSYLVDTFDIYGNAAGTSCRTKIWSKHLAMYKFAVKILFKKKYMFYMCCEAKRAFLRNKFVKLTVEFMRPSKKIYKIEKHFIIFFLFITFVEFIFYLFPI